MPQFIRMITLVNNATCNCVQGIPADNTWLPISSHDQFVNKFLLSPQIAKLTDQANERNVNDLFQRLLTPTNEFTMETPVLENPWSSMLPTTNSEIQSIDQPSWSWPLSRHKRATTQPSKPPDYIPSLPSGVPSPPGVSGASGQSSGGQQATLIIGGFNALLVPVSGISPSNMAGFMQTAETLGNSNPVKPFQAEP